MPDLQSLNDARDVLDSHGVVYETDAILLAIGEHGHNVSLDGPDATMITPEFRWTVRCYANERDPYGTPVDRKMFHGGTPPAALARAFSWIVEREA